MGAHMIEIRPAVRDDLPSITAIYNHYVLHSDAVFDEKPSTIEARTAWFDQYGATGAHRILIAEEGGVILGWASSHPYRAHPAFRMDVETSIMLDTNARGRGIGTLLYEQLFAILAGERVHRVYAGVALPNPASVAIHLRFDFRQIAVYDEYAIKHGRYISSAWFEKKMPPRT